ncbi:hypothetical protein BGZ70_000024 [Mortierella alpina]|uniref:Proteasome inhibitor PI31 subunit n=1 Tax=Mortierella alpina TaxID=64518 RepID=A0A9P6JFC9_MORAP|nr:hypothetical protein BGZ70_000024 [Mortierella alpina]
MSDPQQPSLSAGVGAAANVLDCDSILKLLQDLLPAHSTAGTPSASGEAQSGNAAEQDTSTTTRTTTTLLESPYDGLAALSHAVMTAVGFKLAGLVEDESFGPDRINIDDIIKANALPARWNASSDSYSFKYTHSHSQLTYLIKCVRMASKFVIHGTAIETSKICSLELDIKDFTSPSYFPFTTSTDLTRDPLWNGFISRSRVNDFIGQFKTRVVQVLIPGLSKPGYQEETTSTSNTSTAENTSSSSSGAQGGRGTGGEGRGYYPDDPSSFPGVGGIPRPGFVPRPPIFGDPFSADDPESVYMGGMGGRSPFEIGHSDLDPFGGRIGGGLGGFGGVGGFGGGIGGSTGGGMVVGPNHPMFRRPPPGGGNGGDSGIFGGPQPLPRGSVPPGARFDPIGPFGPGVGQGGGAGNAPGAGTAHRDPLRDPLRQGQGRGRGAPFSGEPDNDEAPPPGYMDMFM